MYKKDISKFSYHLQNNFCSSSIVTYVISTWLGDLGVNQRLDYFDMAWQPWGQPKTFDYFDMA